MSTDGLTGRGTLTDGSTELLKLAAIIIFILSLLGMFSDGQECVQWDNVGRDVECVQYAEEAP